jgi:lipopolysaccharide/colanic/teichoic acid biosynthesis glycosyltransferase
VNAPHARFEAAGLLRHPDRPGEVARPLEKRRLQCYLALILADSAALFAGFGSGGYLYLGGDGLALAGELAQLVFPVFLTIGLYNRAYSHSALERAGFGIGKALTALAISAAAVVFIAFYTRSSLEFSRLGFSLGLALAAACLCWTRLQMRAFIAWRCGERVTNELVIDDGGPLIDLPGARMVSMAALDLEPSLSDPVALHRIGLLLREIDRVVVSCPPERRALWAMILKGANIAGEVLDDAVAELGAQGARIAAGHGFLRVSLGPLGLRARGLKRLFDLVVASIGLLVLAPLMVGVALAILIEDGGPVLFRQRRVGRSNRFFEMYKFRSMRSGASDTDGSLSVRPGDERITRVGRFIRRTSIDELPQLINVLKGEMSVVGPRPHALGSQAGDKLFWEVDDRYWQRHALKPGMTGLAQVRGQRGSTERESDLERRLRSDLEYLHDWTLRRDLAILASTIRVLVHARAY